MEQVPDLIEPIIAWRMWYLRSDGVLTSYVRHAGPGWIPFQHLEAVCLRMLSTDDVWRPLFGSSHEAPWDQCKCGIWGLRSLQDVIEEIGNRHRADGLQKHVNVGKLVAGRVKMWGKIIEGDRGYRAQYAYPESFKVPTNGIESMYFKAAKGDIETAAKTFGIGLVR